MKVFLLTINDTIGVDQTLLDFLNSQPEILNWFYLPPSVFIVSNSNAHVISDLIRTNIPGMLFFITEIVPANNNGFLPQMAWDFINNPKANTVGPNPRISLPNLLPRPLLKGPISALPSLLSHPKKDK